MNKFECKKCGSKELVFTSYAKCLIPVVIRGDGVIEYLEAVVDSDDYIQNTSYFCCSECGSKLGNNTTALQTEQELLVYLISQTLNHEEI